MWIEDEKSCYEHDEELLLSKTVRKPQMPLLTILILTNLDSSFTYGTEYQRHSVAANI
jgi:hypothetical protein